jgi:hypothetical protein
MSSGDEIPSVIQIEKFAHTQFYIAFTRHMEESVVTSPGQPPSHFDGGPRWLPNWSIITGSRNSLVRIRGAIRFWTRAGYEGQLNG